MHWFASTTNFTCVAGGCGDCVEVRSVMSGATGRGLTDGNASVRRLHELLPAGGDRAVAGRVRRSLPAVHA